MSEITIEDPDLVKKKQVDSQGRVYVGREYAEKNVQFILKVLEGDEGNARRAAMPAD